MGESHGPRGIRTREVEFADLFALELQTNDVRTALLNAGRRIGWRWSGTSIYGQMWSQPLTDRQVLKRARAILGRQTVVEYLEYMFDAVGFSPLDGARKLVDHITTATEKDPLGSLDALKHYHALTTKKQAQKVEMDTRMLVAHKFVSAEPPKMRSRALAVNTPELPS